jgi:hypothetical protein
MKLTELDLLKGNIQYHPHLSPAAWDEWTMLPDVHERLLDIAELFVDYLDLPDFDVDDVRLTGSLANFNWTKFSDFDLHIVTDYSKLNCDNIAEALYKAKKTIWNDNHDITINGHDVELYIEDTAKPPHSAGMFSVLDNQWITKPGYMPPTVDKRAVDRKVQVMMDLITQTVRSAQNPNDYKQAIEKVYRMRQNGLEAAGEFSTENLAFKVLRNLGYIDNLRKGYDRFVDATLSLK